MMLSILPTLCFLILFNSRNPIPSITCCWIEMRKEGEIKSRSDPIIIIKIMHHVISRTWHNYSKFDITDGLVAIWTLFPNLYSTWYLLGRVTTDASGSRHLASIDRSIASTRNRPSPFSLPWRPSTFVDLGEAMPKIILERKPSTHHQPWTWIDFRLVIILYIFWKGDHDH